jgi:hypothetical protein
LNDSNGSRHAFPLERFAAPLLLLLAFLVFGRALFNEYAYDAVMLLGRLDAPGARNLSILVSPDDYGPASGVMSWRPLTTLTHIVLDKGLFANTPALSHALNILLHAANAWLLFLLIRRLQWSTDGSSEPATEFFGSLFFLLHPLVTETVYCAGFRFDQMALLFMLLALLATLRSRPPGEENPMGRVWPFTLAALATALALLSKELAAAVVVLAPLVLLLQERRAKGPLLLLILLTIVFALFAALWFQFRYENYTTRFFGDGGRMLGITNFLVSVKEIYLQKFLIPWPLRVDYAMDPVASAGDPRALTAFAVLALLAVAAVLFSWREPLCLVGTCWVILTFLPVSQIVPIPDPVAERFAYVPMAGAALFMTGLLRMIMLKRRAGRLVGIPLLAMLIPMAVLSHARGWQWSDDLTLNIANWEAEPNPDAHALEYLGAVHLLAADRAWKEFDDPTARRHLEQARARLTELLAREPSNGQGHRLMAIVHLRSGDRDSARRHAEQARLLIPADERIDALFRVLDSPSLEVESKQ